MPKNGVKFHSFHSKLGSREICEGLEPKLHVGFDGSGGEFYESCYEIFDKDRKYGRK